MSVVVLNLEEQKIYADTAVSLGHIDCAQFKKARHYHCSGYDVLVGGVGIPDAIDMMTAAAITQINMCAENDWEPGSMPSVMCFSNTEEFMTIRDMINSIFEKTKSPSDLLVMARHSKTGKVYVGMMNDSALIQWDVKPVLGDDCIIIGAVEVVAAWNATDSFAGMYKRLAALRRTVQFLKTPNQFTVTDIYGKTDTYFQD